jgi:hypothetical protein
MLARVARAVIPVQQSTTLCLVGSESSGFATAERVRYQLSLSRMVSIGHYCNTVCFSDKAILHILCKVGAEMYQTA